jgi:hypothetical protein
MGEDASDEDDMIINGWVPMRTKYAIHTVKK